MITEMREYSIREIRMKQSFFPTSTFRLPTFTIIFTLFALMLPGMVKAGTKDTGALTASLDQETVPVGGVVWLKLDYRLPEGGRLPEKAEINGLEGITILKQVVDSQQIRIQLLVDHLGTWQSDSIKLGYLDSDGEPQFLTAESVSVRVASNISETAAEVDLRPIRDIDPVNSIWQGYLLWLIVGIILILGAVGLYWWYKKRQTPASQTTDVEPPHIRARRELRGLEAQQYFENGLVKQHYFVFSEILRQYLEAIRNFPAAEFTTEEIARHVKTAPDRKLVPLLQQADLVKFADAVPTRARKEADFDAALAYIRETSPQIESVQDQAHRTEAGT